MLVQYPPRCSFQNDSSSRGLSGVSFLQQPIDQLSVPLHSTVRCCSFQDDSELQSLTHHHKAAERR